MRPPKCRRRRAGAICGGTAPRRDRPANSTGGRCPANSTSGHCPAPALRVGNGRRGRGPGLWRRTDGHGAAAPSAAMTTSGALHFPGTAPILGVRRPPATTVLCARYAGSGPCRQHMGRPPPPAAARRRPPRLTRGKAPRRARTRSHPSVPPRAPALGDGAVDLRASGRRGHGGRQFRPGLAAGRAAGWRLRHSGSAERHARRLARAATRAAGAAALRNRRRRACRAALPGSSRPRLPPLV